MVLHCMFVWRFCVCRNTIFCYFHANLFAHVEYECKSTYLSGFLLDICKSSLSSGCVTVGSTLRLNWDSALTLGFQTKCHHCPQTSLLSDLDSAQMSVSTLLWHKSGGQGTIFTHQATRKTLLQYKMFVRANVYTFSWTLFKLSTHKQSYIKCSMTSLIV